MVTTKLEYIIMNRVDEICNKINKKYKKKICSRGSDQKNQARVDALYEIKGDLLSWLIFDQVEQEYAIKVIKAIEKYINYLD